MNKRIVAFLGWKGSGKTYISEYLKKHYGFAVLSFSDSLKSFISNEFGIPKDILEGTDEETRRKKEEKLEYWSKVLGCDVTPRTLMTGIGSALRQWNKNIWIALLDNRLNRVEEKYVVVSDARFENEIKYLREKNAKFVWIKKHVVEWFNEGMMASLGDEKAKEFLDRNGIHESEYNWMKYLDECDFIYDNTKKGINRKHLEQILKLIGYEHG